MLLIGNMKSKTCFFIFFRKEKLKPFYKPVVYTL